MALIRNLMFERLSSDDRAPNLLVGAGVSIHPSAQLGANVVIYDDVQIGADAVIKHNCVIGEHPTLAIDSRARPQPQRPTVIGEGATICNAVVIFAGAELGGDLILGDQSYVREGVEIAADCMVGRGCSVGAGASIGSGVKIQNNSIIMPGMTIEDDVSIGAMLSGATEIGEEAFIGAGAVVLDSVPPRAKVAGVPARTIGVVADEELL